MGRLNVWILVAGAALFTPAVTLTAQTAIVVNQGTGGTGNVSVIASNLAVTTVSLAAGSVPVDIAANPAGTLAAIADQNGPRIQFLDLTMNPPTLSGPSVSVAGSGATAQASIQDVRFSSDGACLVEAGGGRIKSLRMSDRTVVTSLDLASVVAFDIARNSIVLALTPSSLKFFILGAGCVLVDMGFAPVSDPNLVGANNIAISPNSQIALVTNSSAAAGGNTVAVFSLNPVVCGTNFVNAIAVGTAGVSGATGVAITPDGTRAYVRVPNAGVKILNIDASNAVTDSGTSISGTSAGSAFVPGAKDIATDGTRLFFSNNTGSTSTAGTVGVVNVGSITQVPGSPVTAGIQPVAVAAVSPVVVPRPIALSTNNRILPALSSGAGGSISVVGPDFTILGTLTLDDSDIAYDLVVNPTGTLAAVAVETVPASHAVIKYYSLATGLPTLSAPSTDLGPIDQVQDIAFSGNGACLVAAQFASRLVSVRMSDRTVVSSLAFSDIVAVDAGSNNVVLAMRDGGAVTAIEVVTLDPGTCALTDVRTVPDTMPKNLVNPTNITISPDGQVALVANTGRNLVDLSKHETNVVAYAITGSGPSTNLGAPVQLPGGVTDSSGDPMSFPTAIAFKPDGTIAYAHIAGSVSSGVRAYNVSGTTVTDAGFLPTGTAGRTSSASKGTDDIATDGILLFALDGIAQGCPSAIDVIRISDNAVLSQSKMFGASQPTAVAMVPPNAQPTSTSVAPASGQYSDPVTLSATVSPAAAGTMQFLVAANPVGTAGVNSSTGVATLPYTISQGAGSYTITAQFTSSDPGFLNSSGTNTLTVSREDATVTPSASNPASVQVASPGGTSPPFSLAATIVEPNDGSPGNTANATPVTCTLTPVGPGSPVMVTASTTGGGVALPLTATCNFSGVPVNVYNVTFTIGGNFYQGSGQSSVIVFDPSLGFVTGGGRVANPNTGAVANFGFNVKSQKDGTSQGSLTYVEHRPGGDLMLKSSSMGPLVIAGNQGIFEGTATLNGVANYTFRVRVIDNGEPSTSDLFGLEVTAPGGATVGDLTFLPVTIASGNIQVPQPGGH